MLSLSYHFYKEELCNIYWNKRPAENSGWSSYTPIKIGWLYHKKYWKNWTMWFVDVDWSGGSDKDVYLVGDNG